MNNKTLTDKITSLLTEQDQLTAQELVDLMDEAPPIIQVYGVLGKMKKDGLVQEEVSEVDGKKRYTKVVEAEKPEKVMTDKRDLSRFSFDGQKGLSKGRLAVAVVKRYVKDNDPTYEELLSVFEHSICKPYGVVQDLQTAHELSPDPKRKRYFFNAPDIIRLNKGEVREVCVTNQWTKERFLKLMEVITNKLKYKIEEGV